MTENFLLQVLSRDQERDFSYLFILRQYLEILLCSPVDGHCFRTALHHILLCV